ncbi:Iron/zinc purple acid phosphatase-like C-terminal domain [Trinorchestia longiramus]|nr:Iron/zinc purple acid phosphatase-like C-terminal domain [Trinorchestia longiramus]
MTELLVRAWKVAALLVLLQSLIAAQLPSRSGHPNAVVVPLSEEGEKVPQWQPRHVHLAYGQNTSSVVVTWSTLSPTTESVVEWGVDLFDLNTRTAGNSSVFVDGGSLASTQYIHRVHLNALQPSTTYYYHVGSSNGWSAVFGFKTAANAGEKPLRLAVYGDLGVTNAQSLTRTSGTAQNQWYCTAPVVLHSTQGTVLCRLQQEAHEGMYDAVLHVGDMAYNMDTENGSVGDAFMDQIESIAAYLPYMTCPGNHESAYHFSQYRSRFSMPQYEVTESLYYSFNMGLVHFIALSTEVYYYGALREINKQYQWLLQDLQAATSPAARAERPWIIVYGHRPMYCSTRDQDDCTNHNCRTRVGLPLLHWCVAARTGVLLLELVCCCWNWCVAAGTGVLLLELVCCCWNWCVAAGTGVLLLKLVHWYGLESVLYEYGVDLAIWAHEHAYERLYPIYNYTVLPGLDHPYVNPRGPVHFTTGSAGCNEKLDDFKLVQPEWSAVRINEYGYTRLTVHNASHLYWEQVADDQVGGSRWRMTRDSWWTQCGWYGMNTAASSAPHRHSGKPLLFMRSTTHR